MKEINLTEIIASGGSWQIRYQKRHLNTQNQEFNVLWFLIVTISTKFLIQKRHKSRKTSSGAKVAFTRLNRKLNFNVSIARVRKFFFNWRENELKTKKQWINIIGCDYRDV